MASAHSWFWNWKRLKILHKKYFEFLKCCFIDQEHINKIIIMLYKYLNL